MSRNLIMHSVYLEPEQIKWLKLHPEFNFSGWTRKELKKYIGSVSK